MPMFQTPRVGIYFNGFGMTMSGKPLAKAPQATSTSEVTGKADAASNVIDKLNTADRSGGSSISTTSSSSSGPGSVSAYGDAKAAVSADPVMYTVERISLGQQMIDAAVALYGKDISFHFDQKLVGVDFER